MISCLARRLIRRGNASHRTRTYCCPPTAITDNKRLAHLVSQQAAIWWNRNRRGPSHNVAHFNVRIIPSFKKRAQGCCFRFLDNHKCRLSFRLPTQDTCSFRGLLHFLPCIRWPDCWDRDSNPERQVVDDILAHCLVDILENNPPHIPKEPSHQVDNTIRLVYWMLSQLFPCILQVLRLPYIRWNIFILKKQQLEPPDGLIVFFGTKKTLPLGRDVIIRREFFLLVTSINKRWPATNVVDLLRVLGVRPCRTRISG